MKKGFAKLHRAGERLAGSLHLDLGSDPGNSVFLAGSGRSGTTWLSEVINHDNEYRYVFEPFYPDKVAVCKNFRRKQYLRPEDQREEFLGPARAILSGRVRSLWTDRFNRKLLVRRRLIKDIRTNLLLGWIRPNFLETPLVFLLRHPCAVTNSRLALGWKDVLDDTLKQTNLIEDFLAPFETEIRNAEGAFERSIFLWCIENYVPLKQLNKEDLLLVFYEDLCTNPEYEVRRLFSFLDKGFDRSVFDSVRRPSRLSRRQDPTTLGERPVDNWKRSMDPGLVQKAVEILALFGLDRVYGEDPVPNREAAYALLGERTGKGVPGDGE